jgi:hypothetical protein
LHGNNLVSGVDNEEVGLGVGGDGADREIRYELAGMMGLGLAAALTAVPAASVLILVVTGGFEGGDRRR